MPLKMSKNRSPERKTVTLIAALVTGVIGAFPLYSQAADVLKK